MRRERTLNITGGKCNKKQDEFREAFAKLEKQAHLLGITKEQLIQLESIKLLRAPNRTLFRLKALLSGCGTLVKPLIIALISLLLILCMVLLTEWPVRREKITELWFEALDTDMEKEPCILEVPEVVQDFTRPPVDCSVCKDVKEIEKRSNLTPEEFEGRYAYSGRPVVITDATVNWTASNVLSFDFFKNIYTEDSPALENANVNCQFFPYKTDFSNLGEVFNMSEERANLTDTSKPWYIGWYVVCPIGLFVIHCRYNKNQISSKTNLYRHTL